MSYNELCYIYGPVCNNFVYLQLLTAIPKTWKSTLIGVTPTLVCRPQQHSSEWLLRIKINKDLYKHFLVSEKLIDIPQNVQMAWLYLFDTPIPWNTVYTSVIFCTIDPVTRFFQYKILHKFLPTNRLLYIWKCVNSPLCSLCHMEEETYLHLFWDCPHVIEFWEKVKTWFVEKVGETLMINSFNIIFGNLNQGASTLGNLIILLAFV